MGAASRLIRAAHWLQRTVFAPALETARHQRWRTASGVRVLYSPATSTQATAPLLLCPGYGAACGDYAALARLFAHRQPVYRLTHPGSDRAAALRLLPMFLARWLRSDQRSAALAARRHIHSQPLRERRYRQLLEASCEVVERTGSSRIDLVAHSFGTDTALLLAGRRHDGVDIGTLYLISPHPPGYLLDTQWYAHLAVRQVVVISGTRDRTRDGVGPEERLQVLRYLPAGSRAIVLPEVAHMDFALPGLGPPGWPELLASELFSPER